MDNMNNHIFPRTPPELSIPQFGTHLNLSLCLSFVVSPFVSLSLSIYIYIYAAMYGQFNAIFSFGDINAIIRPDKNVKKPQIATVM